MRGTVADLPSPHPLAPTLPALFQEDDFAVRLSSAIDTLFAPLFASLDDFSAYIDPFLAPEDFLDWLAACVGVGLDQTWPIERRRALVAAAADLYRTRGTARGLAAQVAIYTGGEVEISESGAAAWSSKPGSAMPGEATPFVLVCVTSPATTIDADRVDEIVAAAKPAHVPHRIEIAGS